MNQSLHLTNTITPLSHTKLEVSINDLMAEHVVRHYFENTSDNSIEAIFTFPIPLDAAFLGMKATLAGETLTAQIQVKHQASRTYDDAISSGNSAVLLTTPEPGVICTTLGNLLPNEVCEIELRFVTLLRVADYTARFSLPLVHRPRYGKWSLDELDTPTHNFAVEHPMSASILVQGLLATAPVSCITHATRFATIENGLELSIAQAMLDRDLVITFDLSTKIPTVARLIADGESTLGLISFVIPQSSEDSNPLDLCLVLDCSGSMDGDAINQSRHATNAIVDALRADDRIQILRFGSTVVPMFRRPLLATQIVRNAIRELGVTIHADLGGTEMDDALSKAMKQLGPIENGRSRSIILVTDGAVQPEDIKKAQSKAVKDNIRIFVVAVGSSAGVEVLKPMAEATNAVLERAVPAEPIDVITMRQFRRAKETGPVKLHINWQNTKAESINTGIFYPGDAAFVAASLPDINAGVDPTIKAFSSNGLCILESNAPYQARIAAPAQRALLGQLRYQTSEVQLRESIALQYGLLTEVTSAVLVKIRASGELGEALPTIVQIPQMINDYTYNDINFCQSTNITSHRPMLVTRHAKVLSIKHQSLSLDEPKFSLRSVKEKLLNIFNNQIDDKQKTISSELALDVFESIYSILRLALLIQNKAFPELFDVLAQLPSHLKSTAQELIEETGLCLTDPIDSIRLLLALNKIFEASRLSEDEEAMLAIKIKFILTHGRSNSSLNKVDNKLVKVIEYALGEIAL